MNDQRTATTQAEKPKFGVRLDRAIVTYWNGWPLLTWEQADECRQKIAELDGTHGEVERVNVVG